ncbi:hypothetical protein NPIL_282521 [Nephila pilipes]|uniref:K Homology domain-containing protein n=1 Tax=Nephila pilipes TaxID=299642 RepID=A0A8X6MTX2_NEPPI|nr:hypothetical protein NPIL_282521 [Nephila pilipes]
MNSGNWPFESLLIPKMYRRFIIGPFNETINQIIREAKAKINISPVFAIKDELTIAGEKDAVTKTRLELKISMRNVDKLFKKFYMKLVHVLKCLHQMCNLILLH